MSDEKPHENDPVTPRGEIPGDVAPVEAAFAGAGSPPNTAPADPPSRGASDTGRNLLFGLLALQNNFIDRDALLAAFNTWVTDKSTSLGDVLHERGVLDGSRHALLAALVSEHLKLHGGDPERSLAALSVGDSTRKSIEGVGDTALVSSLSHAGTRATVDAAGDGAAALYRVDISSARGRRFRVLRPHAEGGLGAVFVALDSELNREVALKQILDRHADDLANRNRFLMEAEITGRLEHPGIVPVYGLGTYDDGRPYYAMRFIRGDSLKEAIASFHADTTLKADPGRQSLELRKLLRRFLDVCNAIDYAHSRGVLHRDVKPGNVIVGKHGETLVVDWGLAKPLGQREPGSPSDEQTLRPLSADGSAKTLPGVAVGTPAYMSPEQADGETDQLGPRSDVYSLGATLYCLLTGRAPFGGGDLDALLRKVSRGAFPPPRRVAPAVDRALEAVCLKAMALRPVDRYATPRALADDVERWIADEPVLDWREPLVRRARRWIRRHRTLVTTAAVVLLLGLAGLAAFAAVVGDKNRKLVAANSATRKAETLAEARLDRAMASIEDYFTGFSEDALKGGRLPPALRDRLLSRPRQFYEQLAAELAAKTDPSERERVLLGRGQFGLGRILEVLGKFEEARAQGEAALATFEGLVSRRPDSADYQDRLARCHGILGSVLDAKGRSSEAAGAYKKAITIWESLASRHPDVPDYQNELAHYHDNLAILFASTGRYDEAAEAYGKAITITGSLATRYPDVPAYRSGLVVQYNNFGALRTGTGRFDDAVRLHRKALAIAEELTARHPDVNEYQHWLAASHGSLANALHEMGRTDQAIGARGKVVTIYEGVVAREPGVVDFQDGLARSYANLALDLAAAGRSGEAVAEFQKAATIFEALSARQPDVPLYLDHLATMHNGLGNAFSATGRSDEAAAAYQKAATSFAALVARYPKVPAHQEGLASAQLGLGNAFSATGRSDEAAAAYQKAVSTGEALVARHPSVPPYANTLAYCHNNFGLFLKSQGRLVDALAEFQRATTFTSPGSPLAVALPRQIRETEAAIPLLQRLPAVLKREDQPKDATEGLAFARLCYDLSRYAASARFWTGALAAEPGLADDREALPRYNAACAAALAAAGKGKNEPAPDDDAKRKLRKQARDWLRAELDAWTKVLESGPTPGKAVVAQTLQGWQVDTDLAGVRERPALEALPDAERKDWADFWADVGALIRNARLLSTSLPDDVFARP